VRFSESFGIVQGPDEEWFDPHLTVDTRLFIDPVLLLLAGPYWREAHDELLNHFVECYRLVARALSPDSVSANAARRLLVFPEPKEFGLGFTSQGTAGSGSAMQSAHRMADGIAVAINAGLAKPEHIEEIAILNKGLGADRISDAVCNVLKRRFIEYTQAVAERHEIPLQEHRVKNSRVLLDEARWVTEEVLLPTNRETGGPILLVPRPLLNDLPSLNAEAWYDSDLNGDLRDSMNATLGRRARKEEIVELARKHPERVRQWADRQTTRPDLHGYNFSDDPKGVVQWDGAPVAFALAHPIDAPEPGDQEALSALVAAILDRFKNFIEQQRGWSLLWNEDGKAKPEEAAQLVFLGMAQPYLRLHNVELDREVELGRGPVDFKIASGARLRLLVEVKKEDNGKFWNGLEAQLPSYLVSDDAPEGWFVAIRYRSGKAADARLMQLPKRTKEISAEVGRTIRFIAIDARRPVSASKIVPKVGPKAK
jgi:hypothetical protein